VPLPARPCRRQGQVAAPRSTSCAAKSTPSRRRSRPLISSGRQSAAGWTRWYHRARTAIRHKRQQIAALTAHIPTLPTGPGRKAGFKDCLIKVLRDEFDDEAWQAFLDRANSLHARREVA
jgi:hypothetical protein